MQRSMGQGVVPGWCGAVQGWYSPHAVQGPCSVVQCGAGAVWCRCGAGAEPCSAGQGQPAPPSTPALTAQEGLDVADKLPQLLVGALHAGPGLVRLVQGCLRPQPGLICLPLGFCHLSRDRDPQRQPQGLWGTAMPPAPSATHLVGELGHIASSPTQLLLRMACPVQRTVSRGHSPTAAQTPAAPSPVFVPAPSSPAGALGTGHVACRTADLKGSVGLGRLWASSPPGSPPRVPPSH